MDLLTDPQAWIALATLTLMEIVLGVDNIIFISILTGDLPKEQQPRARQIGLLLAMGMRIGLLLSLTWLMGLTAPLFTLFENEFSGRDLILLSGGLFLLGKSTVEIHKKIAGEAEDDQKGGKRAASFASVLVQIMLLDVVFSLDSVITAIGMVQEISIMVVAVVISVGFMMLFVGAIDKFVQNNPTVKILALSFLMLIGTALIGEGLELHIPKGYIYFAMAFSAFIEFLNMRFRKKAVTPGSGQTSS